MKNSAGLAGIGFLGTSMEHRFKEADKQVGADGVTKPKGKEKAMQGDAA